MWKAAQCLKSFAVALPRPQWFKETYFRGHGCLAGKRSHITLEAETCKLTLGQWSPSWCITVLGGFILGPRYSDCYVSFCQNSFAPTWHSVWLLFNGTSALNCQPKPDHKEGGASPKYLKTGSFATGTLTKPSTAPFKILYRAINVGVWVMPSPLGPTKLLREAGKECHLLWETIA